MCCFWMFWVGVEDWLYGCFGVYVGCEVVLVVDVFENGECVKCMCFVIFGIGVL